MIRTAESPADLIRWLESKAADLWPAILGSLSFRRSARGRENCPHCLSGEQHWSHVLYGRHNGRQFAVYVPEDLVAQVRRAVENGCALQDLLAAAETERPQKIIIVAVLLVLAATPAVSATDHRLGWSSGPAVVVVLADLLIVLAHIGFCLVLRANTYGVATIQVAQGQNVISTGPYAVICHPTYAWNVPMVLGALALGSWWGRLWWSR
jgi:isoprenylcysteine carboxyl methyltransferase (ICMT) family protein YpbQ